MRLSWLLLLALLAPLAHAGSARVDLVESGGAWNGESQALAHDGSAVVWVPRDARIHNVSLPNWRLASSDAIFAPAADGESLVVTFDAPRLSRYVAPEDVNVTIAITPAPGFASAGDGAYTLGRGETVRLRVFDADRVGELPILVAVGVAAVASFAVALVWHALRPPAPRSGAKSFLDHLSELQARIVPPILIFAALNLFYFVFGLKYVTLGNVTLIAPTLSTSASLATRAFDSVSERLVPDGVALVALRPVDAVLAQVEIALFLAFITILPLLVFEVAAFVKPALQERERRVASRVIPVVFSLFIVGSGFGFALMAPLMLRTLYEFAPAVGATALLGVGDLISFALLITLSFAVAFELPVVMYTLSRLGAVEAKTWRKYARHAVLIIFVAAGILTPDPSVVSQLLVAVPVTGLYLVGALAALVGERQRSHARARDGVAS